MKKLLFYSILLSSTMFFAQDKIIYSQDFESAVAGTELLGNVQVKKFATPLVSIGLESIETT